MAKIKFVDKDVEEIKTLLKENKEIIGTERVLKGLRLNTIGKVFVALNCNEETLGNIESLAKLSKVEIIKLKQPNDELGIICKKPFSISVLGIKR